MDINRVWSVNSQSGCSNGGGSLWLLFRVQQWSRRPTDRYLVPRVLGVESKLSNDLTECLEFFHEMNDNDQIIFPMLSLCRCFFSTYPVLCPLLRGSKVREGSWNWTRGWVFEKLGVQIPKNASDVVCQHELI